MHKGIEHTARAEVLVRRRDMTMSVPTDQIYYIESNNRKVILYTDQNTIEYYGKIGELERQLQGEFFRIHRGYLVNMRYVTGYGRSEVRVTNGDVLLLSKYKYRDFVEAYQQFMAEETKI
ncbi:MAG: LytTR family transcriptional regulator DNA-binding domain-containing protein [Clostridium sp.]|nr:LytTR family transcriptional regulator DNA-binding domain-containing protein [Acetatifactor muris]MCM1526820.1 LytTR family transcriptional regulator DNA-binding domain-containing protein [Bacteroides sp.]MCM1562979.1 LytTR family transcriptional regulator DNA-binding domain-containing protein [Clostridium sp.]